MYVLSSAERNNEQMGRDWGGVTLKRSVRRGLLQEVILRDLNRIRE